MENKHEDTFSYGLPNNLSTHNSRLPHSLLQEQLLCLGIMKMETREGENRQGNPKIKLLSN